jgi:hypothetical protein
MACLSDDREFFSECRLYITKSTGGAWPYEIVKRREEEVETKGEEDN